MQHRTWRRLGMHRSIARAIALALVLGGITQDAFAREPRLIADFAKSPSRSQTLPASLLPLGDRVVFLTNDATVLWASDVEPVLQADVFARSCDSQPVAWMAPAGKRALLF